MNAVFGWFVDWFVVFGCRSSVYVSRFEARFEFYRAYEQFRVERVSQTRFLMEPVRSDLTIFNSTVLFMLGLCSG